MTKIAPNAAPSPNLSWKHAVLWWLIAVGIACRFVGLNWDDGAHLHPDERFLTMTTPTLVWPHSVSEYFETNRAGLNPFNHKVNFFVYGQLPLVLVKAVAGRLSSPDQINRDNYDGILVVGRAVAALFDAGTVLLVFFIGRRCGGVVLGLLAASLLAFVPLHIQQAHFFVVDSFATFFLTASFLSALALLSREEDKPLSRRKWVAACCAGLWWGAAIACKISAAMFGVVILLSLLAHWRIMREVEGSRAWRSTMGAALIIFTVAFITFRLAHPVAFQGEARAATMWGLLDVRPAPQFWNAVREQAEISSGDRDPGPWNYQWIGRRDFIWPLRNLMLWGVGWPLLLTAIAGIALMMVHLARRRPIAAALPIAAVWTLVVFFYHAGTYSKFTRYYLVITPFLALCAAWFMVHLMARAHGAWRGPAQAVTGFIVGATALWGLACTSIYTRPHTRVTASRWIYQHIVAGTAIANETSWDETLPLYLPRHPFPEHTYSMLKLELYDFDNAAKRGKLLDNLDKAEWIFISSNRVWGTVPRVPQRWPLTTAYFRALFDGRLGFKLEKQFTSYPQLTFFGHTIAFPDDTMEEAITVYDHPRVLLFHKTAAWSRQNAERILDPSLLNEARDVPLPQIRDSGWQPDEATLPWPPEAQSR